MKTKQSEKASSLITKEIADGIQDTARDIIALDHSSGEVGIMMYSAGITIDMLTPGTKKKENPQFNETLWKDVRMTIIASPAISEELRKAFLRAEQGLQPESVHTMAFRDTAQRYVRDTLKAIRKGIQRAMNKSEGNGANARKSLAKWVDEQLNACIEKVRDGETSKDNPYSANAFPTALASLRKCKAELNTAFATK